MYELAGLYLVCGIVALIGCSMALFMEFRRRQLEHNGEDSDDITSMLDVPSRKHSVLRKMTSGVGMAQADSDKLTELLALVRKLEGSAPNAAASQAGVSSV